MNKHCGVQQGARRIGVIGAGSVAAGVHAGLAPEHLQEWLPLGVSFICAAVIASGLVIAVALRPDDVRRTRALAIVLAGLVLAYLLAHLTALPPLDPDREPFDPIGLLTVVAELAGTAAALLPGAASPIRSNLALTHGGIR